MQGSERQTAGPKHRPCEDTANEDRIRYSDLFGVNGAAVSGMAKIRRGISRRENVEDGGCMPVDGTSRQCLARGGDALYCSYLVSLIHGLGKKLMHEVI